MSTLNPPSTVATVSANPKLFEAQEKLASLESDLIAGTPNISTLLRDIHRTLKADESLVTILSAEECSILVRGLKKQTNTEIAVAAIKKPARKSLKSLSVDDL